MNQPNNVVLSQAMAWWERGLLSDDEIKEQIEDCACNGVFPAYCENCLALKTVVLSIRERNLNNAYPV